MPSRKKQQQAQKAEMETVSAKCYSIIEVDPAGEDPDLLETISDVITSLGGFPVIQQSPLHAKKKTNDT
ncbi:hypothetical protein EJB05_49454 [Eragrostis curvula]|uniref:Uncharacterized protein n=1 Tax=Eragrostis curvula TaxID=38414 RepID=A0A5J9T4J6_9POAL|nr:hypothetical protein EJB05_49454 [Eragrostis curvula]